MMRPPTYPDSFLDDVLADTAAPGLRTALLERMLRAARARQRRRKLGSMLAVFVLCLVPIVLFRPARFARETSNSVQSMPKAFAPSPSATRPACAIIRSQPLPPGMLVRTEVGTVPVIVSSRAGLAIVETVPSPGLVRELSDQELLTLLAGRPAAIVRPPDQAAELLFVNPEDQNGFPIR
jgi:hypothetical protein